MRGATCVRRYFRAGSAQTQVQQLKEVWQVLAAVSGPKAGGRPVGLEPRGTIKCEVAIAPFCVPGWSSYAMHILGPIETDCSSRVAILLRFPILSTSLHRCCKRFPGHRMLRPGGPTHSMSREGFAVNPSRKNHVQSPFP